MLRVMSGFNPRSRTGNDGNPFYDMIIEMMKKYSELDDKSKTVIREYFRGVADGMHKEKQED